MNNPRAWIVIEEKGVLLSTTVGIALDLSLELLVSLGGNDKRNG